EPVPPAQSAAPAPGPAAAPSPPAPYAVQASAPQPPRAVQSPQGGAPAAEYYPTGPDDEEVSADDLAITEAPESSVSGQELIMRELGATVLEEIQHGN
ncbi:DNA polymerase III subunit gamma and tau, partial [Kitasatospora sp. LaBMicrA B282]